MTTDDTQVKDSIARALDWEEYDAAPHIVRNNIDDLVASGVTADTLKVGEEEFVDQFSEVG